MDCRRITVSFDTEGNWAYARPDRTTDGPLAVAINILWPDGVPAEEVEAMLRAAVDRALGEVTLFKRNPGRQSEISTGRE